MKKKLELGSEVFLKSKNQTTLIMTSNGFKVLTSFIILKILTKTYWKENLKPLHIWSLKKIIDTC
jgi:hypothetical protein